MLRLNSNNLSAQLSQASGIQGKKIISEDTAVKLQNSQNTYKDMADLRITQMSNLERPIASEKGSCFSFKPVIVLANNIGPVTLHLETHEPECQSYASKPAADQSGFSFYKLEDSRVRGDIRSRQSRHLSSDAIVALVDTMNCESSDAARSGLVNRISSYLGVQVTS